MDILMYVLTTTICMSVKTTQFLVQEGNDVVETRKQLPLDLCYGMTIHKRKL